MTIVASVKVRDGLTLGTDSMTHIHANLPGGPQFLTAYQNARKLFQVGQLPIGVMSYGLGNLGQRSIESLMREFGKTLSKQVACSTIAQALYDFIEPQYSALYGSLKDEQKPHLGFFLAGYSRGQVFAEEKEFLLPRDSAPVTPRPKDQFGSNWRGIDIPFIRLCKGYDGVILERLLTSGMAQAAVHKIIADLEMQVVYDGMPVQDAVNFVTFILKTTIGYTTFSTGVPACGGPLQVATILPDDGFTWVSRPDVQAT
jgi:hypothetical protein